MAVPQAQRVEIARSAERVAPHHGKLAVTDDGQRGVAALADGAVRRFVQEDVARPTVAGIVGEYAVQALALAIAIVQPGGGHVAFGIADHGVQSLACRLGCVVDRDWRRPGAPAIGGSPHDQVAGIARYDTDHDGVHADPNSYNPLPPD